MQIGIIKRNFLIRSCGKATHLRDGISATGELSAYTECLLSVALLVAWKILFKNDKDHGIAFNGFDGLYSNQFPFDALLDGFILDLHGGDLLLKIAAVSQKVDRITNL